MINLIIFLRLGNRSIAEQTLLFERVASSEIMQTFIPSLMLSIASSSSLYVNPDRLPARIGLCGTTFLSMIALFKGSRYVSTVKSCTL